MEQFEQMLFLKNYKYKYIFTYNLLCSTVQHNRRSNDAVVAFVEVAVVRRIKVLEDEHCLKLSVLSITKLLNVVCDDARRVDVLQRKKHNMSNEAAHDGLVTQM